MQNLYSPSASPDLHSCDIYSDDAIYIFIYNSTLRIHTEGTHAVSVFLSPVHNLALVKFIGQMRKYNCRKLHAHTNIHTI